MVVFVLDFQWILFVLIQSITWLLEASNSSNLVDTTGPKRCVKTIQEMWLVPVATGEKFLYCSNALSLPFSLYFSWFCQASPWLWSIVIRVKRLWWHSMWRLQAQKTWGHWWRTRSPPRQHQSGTETGVWRPPCYNQSTWWISSVILLLVGSELFAL